MTYLEIGASSGHNVLQKNSYLAHLNKYFREMELSSSSIKKFLIFSQKKSFLMFQERETPKKFLMFQETKLSGSNLQSSKNKKNPLLIRRNNNKIDSIENWC